MEQKTAGLPGGPVQYLEAGSGPVLIFLHGGGLDNAELSWGHVIPYFARRFRVLAPNWPGYGVSPISSSYQTTEGLITCLQHLLDYWSVDDANLAGISMGGGVALGMAVANADRVNSLILTGSYGLQSHAPMHKLGYIAIRTPGVMVASWRLLCWSKSMTRMVLGAIMQQRSAVTEELVSSCHESVCQRAAGEAFLTWQRSEVLWNRLRTCYMDQLSRIAIPTLIIHGEKDPLVPLEAARKAAERLPSCTLRVYRNTGHWPQREIPDQYVQDILQFL